jgi:hypothetical protein
VCSPHEPTTASINSTSFVPLVTLHTTTTAFDSFRHRQIRLSRFICSSRLCVFCSDRCRRLQDRISSALLPHRSTLPSHEGYTDAPAIAVRSAALGSSSLPLARLEQTTGLPISEHRYHLPQPNLDRESRQRTIISGHSQHSSQHDGSTTARCR